MTKVICEVVKKSTMILKLIIVDTKSCSVFKTAFTKFGDTATISDLCLKNFKVEEVIGVKVGSDKELTSIDLDCFNEITLCDLSTSAPGVVMSVKIIKQ